MADAGIIRSIGGFTASVTVDEKLTTSMTVTEHPVEAGANISDHAYMNPNLVTVHAGWSNSDPAAQGDSAYIDTIYAKLLAFQKSRTPFTVTTGRKQFTNMLILAMDVVTDANTEESLMVTLNMREVILASTQQVTLPAPAAQAQPQTTAGTVQRGTQQLTPITTQSVP